MPNLIEGRPTLIVIDMQKGGDGGIPHMPDNPERVPRSLRVIDAARQAHIPIVFFLEQHRRGMVDFGRELDGSEGVHLLEGTRASELIDELQPRGDEQHEYVITKRRYSAFFGTDFEILLKGLKAQTLIMLGGLTDVCVHYSFVDAHQHDYHVRVVEDCCRGSSETRHAAALDAMEYLQTGARRQSAEIVEAFLALRTPVAAKG